MNTFVSATTSKAPYTVVFGPAARTSCAVLDMLAQQGVVNKEDIDGSLIECDEDQQVELAVNSSTSEPTQVEMSMPLSEESRTLDAPTFSKSKMTVHHQRKWIHLTKR